MILQKVARNLLARQRRGGRDVLGRGNFRGFCRGERRREVVGDVESLSGRPGTKTIPAVDAVFEVHEPAVDRRENQKVKETSHRLAAIRAAAVASAAWVSSPNPFIIPAVVIRRTNFLVPFCLFLLLNGFLLVFARFLLRRSLLPCLFLLLLLCILLCLFCSSFFLFSLVFFLLFFVLWERRNQSESLVKHRNHGTFSPCVMQAHTFRFCSSSFLFFSAAALFFSSSFFFRSSSF